MQPSILVTGDISLDEDFYVGERKIPGSTELGTHLITTPGGALTTWNLLKRLAGRTPDPTVSSAPILEKDIVFGLRQKTLQSLQIWPEAFRVRAVWKSKSLPHEEMKEGEKKQKRWRLAESLGYGIMDGRRFPARIASKLEGIAPRIVVIDDGALGFRNDSAQSCWPAQIKARLEPSMVEWIILKMASPLANGALWHLLKDKWSDRLIVVVSASDLRRANVRLAEGLSWEQTVEDLLYELDKQGPLQDLRNCRHLIVPLASDGAMWVSHPGDPNRRGSHLVFDRKRSEGEFDEETGGLAPYGSLSVITAGIAWRLWYDEPSQSFIPALKAGLSATRLLRELGHGTVEESRKAQGFPLKETAHELRMPIFALRTARLDEPTAGIRDKGHLSEEPEWKERARYTYASVEVPASVSVSLRGAPGRQNRWSILKATPEGAAGQLSSKGTLPPPLFGIAHRLALDGPGALGAVPYARLGKLLTMDRGEIESLRSVRRLMLSYEAESAPKRPLSIAVFGAPGSGKSFGLREMALSVFKEKPLEFNLSQFKGPEELYGAYHQVRDRVLARSTPVVFWDEFDSREFFWLQYLLAPMQDGVFQEGQLTHAIGKCVFVFAGGTSYDYEHFGPPETPTKGETRRDQDARRQFALQKGPDFRSRLAAVLNVLGPNPRKRYDGSLRNSGGDPWVDDRDDLEYPVRRAIQLRAGLGCGSERDENKRLKIDSGLLTALLEAGHYRNGSRSLEKLLAYIFPENNPVASRANLPHREILELLIDNVDDFYNRLNGNPF